MGIEWCKLYGLERYLLEVKDNVVNLYDLLSQFRCESAYKMSAFIVCKTESARKLVAALMVEYEDNGDVG